MSMNNPLGEMGNKYFEDLLQRIREIKINGQPPKRKIAEILATAYDYNNEDGKLWLSMITARSASLDDGGHLRFANCLILRAEGYAVSHTLLTMKTIGEYATECVHEARNNQHIYEHPCFYGDYEEDADEESNEMTVSLPRELADFKGSSVILKIKDMDRFVDTFCNRDTYYRRAYAILADLDKEVLEGLENGFWPTWYMIPYKEWGDAMFEFSHFEVDLREPDAEYRTLYIVYRYDTTVS